MSDSLFRDKDRVDSSSEIKTASNYMSNRVDTSSESGEASPWKDSNLPLTDNELSELLDELIPTVNLATSEAVSPATEIQSLREALRSRGLRGLAALQCICVTVARVTCATGSAIGIAEGNEIICRASWGNAPDLGAQVNQNSGLSGACVRTAAVAYCRDSENDTRVNAEACRRLQMRSIVIVPVLLDRRVDGLVEVFAPVPDAFSSDQIEFLKSVANLVLELASGEALPSKPAVLLKPTPPVSSATPSFTPPPISAAPVFEKPIVPPKPVTPPTAAFPTAAAPTPAKEQAQPVLKPEPKVQLQPLAELVTEPEKTEKVKALPDSSNKKLVVMPTPEKPDREMFAESSPDEGSNSKIIVAGVAAALLLAAGIGWMVMKPSQSSSPANAVAPTTQASNQPANSVPVPAPAQTTPTTGGTSATAINSNSKNTKPVSNPTVEAKTDTPKKADEAPKRSQNETIIEDKTTPVRFVRPSVAPQSAAVPLAGVAAPPVAILPQTAVAALNLPSAGTTASASLAPIPRSSLQSGGKLLKRVEPIYPVVARNAHLEGIVVLNVTVSKEGGIKEIKVVSGAQLLAGAAIEAVRQWQYEPYKLNGVPQERETSITIRFSVPRS